MFRKEGNKRQFKFKKIMDNNLEAVAKDLQKTLKPVDDKAVEVLANVDKS